MKSDQQLSVAREPKSGKQVVERIAQISEQLGEPVVDENLHLLNPGFFKLEDIRARTIIKAKMAAKCRS